VKFNALCGRFFQNLDTQCSLLLLAKTEIPSTIKEKEISKCNVETKNYEIRYPFVAKLIQKYITAFKTHTFLFTTQTISLIDSSKQILLK
jgi:hypothetical protein